MPPAGGCCTYCFLSGCYVCGIPAGNTRGMLRAKYGLPEEPYSDCVVHTLCAPCALCQDAREVKIRA